MAGHGLFCSIFARICFLLFLYFILVCTDHTFFFQDIDCMPLNPSENMPDALRRKNLVVDKISEAFYETKQFSQQQDRRFGESLRLLSSENVENGEGNCNVASSSYPMNTLMKQANVRYFFFLFSLFFGSISECCSLTFSYAKYLPAGGHHRCYCRGQSCCK